jgi:hypothetical protein
MQHMQWQEPASAALSWWREQQQQQQQQRQHLTMVCVFSRVTRL